LRDAKRKNTSFSEEKEAKRLLSRFLGAAMPPALPNGEKFFGSFFQKRTILPHRAIL
jgi:hypothetical protein